MRKNKLAELNIICPTCKKPSNEYNWTLKTAAYFSQKEETCPTVISVIRAIHQGEGEMFYGFHIFCPLCNYGTDIEEVKLPTPDAVEKYILEVGQEYVDTWL